MRCSTFRIGFLWLVIAVFIQGCSSTDGPPKPTKKDVVDAAVNAIERSYFYGADEKTLKKCRREIWKFMRDWNASALQAKKLDCLKDDKYAVFYKSIIARESRRKKSTMGDGTFIGATFMEYGKGGKNRFRIAQIKTSGPAYKAGLREGDILSWAYDANKKRAENVAEALELVRGERGKTIYLKVDRNGEHIMVGPVTGKKVKDLPSVIEERKYGNIGYVKIHSFSPSLPQDIRKILQEFTDKGLKHLIVDLRGNPGGSDDVVLPVLTLFNTQSDDIFFTGQSRRKLAEYPIELAVRRAHDLYQFSSISGEFSHYLDTMIILINGKSASATEIFAGVLQEKGVLVVGSISQGKGVGQESRLLPKGYMIKFTTGKVLLGNDKVELHGVGIQPNCVVKNFKLPLGTNWQMKYARTILENLEKGGEYGCLPEDD